MEGNYNKLNIFNVSNKEDDKKKLEGKRLIIRF
jgi:hypothetical protein